MAGSGRNALFAGCRDVISLKLFDRQFPLRIFLRELNSITKGCFSFFFFPFILFSHSLSLSHTHTNGPWLFGKWTGVDSSGLGSPGLQRAHCFPVPGLPARCCRESQSVQRPLTHPSPSCPLRPFSHAFSLFKGGRRYSMKGHVKQP